MNERVAFTRGQYLFFERPLISLISGLELFLIMFLNQAITEVTVLPPIGKEQRFFTELLTKVAVALLVLGLYIFGQTMIDMKECDVYGFGHLR